MDPTKDDESAPEWRNRTLFAFKQKCLELIDQEPGLDRNEIFALLRRIKECTEELNEEEHFFFEDEWRPRPLRPPVPHLCRQAMSEEEAVILLQTAEEMYRTMPGEHSTRCALVEALILCNRFGDALEKVQFLHPSDAERYYYQAEAEWRIGPTRLEAALGALQQGLTLCDDLEASNKLKQLELMLLRQQKAYEAVNSSPSSPSSSSTTTSSSVQAWTNFLCTLPCGEGGTVFHNREDGSRPRCLCPGAFGAAATGLSSCLRLSPSSSRAKHEEALLLLDEALGHTNKGETRLAAQLRFERALLLRTLGKFQDSFLDFQRIGRLAPDAYPDLLDHLQEAATLVTDHMTRSSPCPFSSSSPESPVAKTQEVDGGGRLYELLGITPSATAKDITNSYRKLALLYHPDKCVQNKRHDAHQMFQRIALAYATLSNPLERAQYDFTFTK